MSLDERRPRWQHLDLKHDDQHERWLEDQAEALYYEQLDPFTGRVKSPLLADNYGVDARTFPSAGSDEVGCWRHPEVPDVPGDAA